MENCSRRKKILTYCFPRTPPCQFTEKSMPSTNDAIWIQQALGNGSRYKFRFLQLWKCGRRWYILVINQIIISLCSDFAIFHCFKKWLWTSWSMVLRAWEIAANLSILKDWAADLTPSGNIIGLFGRGMGFPQSPKLNAISAKVSELQMAVSLNQG